MPELELSQGRVRYRDSGSGEPIVFLHGALVNGELWRKVVPELDGEFRCVVPDLPLGSHPIALRPEADTSPPGVARLVADLLEALGLERVTLVGNDTGGAIAQLVATRHPERLARLVLTPCDAYDNFLPLMFRYLQVTARIPGGALVLAQSLRLRALRRAPFAFGWLAKRPIDDDVLDAWAKPIISDAGVRRDATKLLKGISKRQTLEAAERLRSFDRPVLLAWAPEDRFFKFEHAERLAREIPDARLERVEDSYTFVSEDQPKRVAELVARFVRETGAASG